MARLSAARSCLPLSASMPASLASVVPGVNRPHGGVVGGVAADDGLHELVLVDGAQHGAADGRVVERRHGLVEAEEADQAVGLHHFDAQAARWRGARGRGP